MNRPTLKLARSILLLLLFGISAIADEGDTPEVLVQFLPKISEGHAGNSSVTELQQGDSLPAGEYLIKAKATLATEKAPEVIDSYTLRWVESSAAHVRTPNAKFAPLILPFEAVRGDGDREINITDFDELWLDFSKDDSGKACGVSVEMAGTTINMPIEAKGGSDKRELRLVSNPLSPTLSLDFVSANWKPRDNFYLAKRMFGSEFDEDWRYMQSRKNTVIQRRFHQDLQGVEALDLFFASGTKVERVNILVSWKDHLSPDEIIEWDAMSKQIESAAGGTRVRLYLGEVVRAHSSAQKRKTQVFLAEVVAFIPGKVERVVSQRPVHALVFQSLPLADSSVMTDNIVHLPQHKKSVSQGYGRLVVDLRPLAKMEWEGVGFKSGIVTLNPKNPARYCGIRPTSLRLVTLREVRRNLTTSIEPTEGKPARLLGKNKNSRMQSVVLTAVGFLLMGWAWVRRGTLRYLRERVLLLMRQTRQLSRNILVGIAGWAWHVIIRYRVMANRAVGVFMLVIGLWLMGGMKVIPLASDMVGFALLLSAGSLWHELRWRNSRRMERPGLTGWWFGSPDKIPTFVQLLTAIVAGWTAWNMVHSEIYGALLPLIGTGYYYLPWSALAVRWCRHRIGATWAWSFVTIALYYLGLKYGNDRGGSYFFTIGGFSAVLVWRAWLMSVRVRLEAYWPLVAKIYGGSGTLYFAGAIVGLIMMALLVMVQFEFLAEQMAIAVYNFLLVGTVLEILLLRRESRREAVEKGKSTAEDIAR